MNFSSILVVIFFHILLCRSIFLYLDALCSHSKVIKSEELAKRKALHRQQSQPLEEEKENCVSDCGRESQVSTAVPRKGKSIQLLCSSALNWKTFVCRKEFSIPFITLVSLGLIKLKFTVSSTDIFVQISS